MMIALPAAEVFRGRRSREENRGGLRANGVVSYHQSHEIRRTARRRKMHSLDFATQDLANCGNLCRACS